MFCCLVHTGLVRSSTCRVGGVVRTQQDGQATFSNRRRSLLRAVGVGALRLSGLECHSEWTGRYGMPYGVGWYFGTLVVVYWDVVGTVVR